MKSAPAPLQMLLYAGTYLVRNVEQVQDYTSYAHVGAYVDYYQCFNPKPGNATTAQCFTPSAYWRDSERNTHQSHELRLGTPDNWRIRGVGGLFYEKYRIQDRGDWYYLTALPYFTPIGSSRHPRLPGSSTANPPARASRGRFWRPATQ